MNKTMLTVGLAALIVFLATRKKKGVTVAPAVNARSQWQAGTIGTQFTVLDRPATTVYEVAAPGPIARTPTAYNPYTGQMVGPYLN